MLVVGGIMTVMGGDTISDIEWDVEGESVFEGPGGTYAHSSDDLMIIYVDDTVDCESFTLTSQTPPMVRLGMIGMMMELRTIPTS